MASSILLLLLLLPPLPLPLLPRALSLPLPIHDVPPLRFEQPTFKIALFADLHYGEDASGDWGPAQDRSSTRVMSYVLDVEKPDFVIFLGDILTANNLPTANATKYWNQALSATMKRNIPWASVFGNHDDMAFEWPMEWFDTAGIPGFKEGGSGIDQYFSGTIRAELMRNEMSNALSLSMNGPRDLWPSISNYVIEIASSQNPTSTAVILYFLDSGGGSYPEVISASQADWFQAVSAELNPDERIPEIAFWHIPSYAYKKVAPKPGSIIQHPCVGSINLESIDPQEAEFGIMDLLSRRSSMKALFVGHNHGLDWCCPYKSMFLCFARHTGYGGYGTWTRGARILDLVEEPFELNSYIRLENGTVTSWLELFKSKS